MVPKAGEKKIWDPSRLELMRQAGQASQPEEILTLTAVKGRDKYGGVVADETGLRLLKDADGIYVRSIKPDTMATALGLLPGDGLVELNGAWRSPFPARTVHPKTGARGRRSHERHDSEDGGAHDLVVLVVLDEGRPSCCTNLATGPCAGPLRPSALHR